METFDPILESLQKLNFVFALISHNTFSTKNGKRIKKVSILGPVTSFL